MGWFTRLYDRRVVNVNVNIVVAGAAALGVTVGVMHQAEEWGVIAWLDETIAPVSREFIINFLTFWVDVVADVAAYYVLHFVANHMPRRVPRIRGAGYVELSFLRDATLVQFERAVLSPLLYVIALSLQHMLLKGGHSVAYSTAMGFGCGIAAVRVLHTFWMLRNEQRAIKGGTDLISANPLIEKSIRWLMPRQTTTAGPDARATPHPSGSPSSAGPGPRTEAGGAPGAPDRTRAPAVPQPERVKTPR